MEFVTSVVFPALATILTALASWGVTAFVKWVNSKIKNEKVKQAIEQAQGIINSAVATISQTYVDELKKSGKFDEAAKGAAMQKTLTLVKEQLTKEATELIGTATNDVTLWINTQIEKAVRESK